MPSPHFLSYTALNREALLKHKFADDASGGSRQENIHSWWLGLVREGLKNVNFINPPKTWLLVKNQHLKRAKELFGSTDGSIISAGRLLLQWIPFLMFETLNSS